MTTTHSGSAQLGIDAAGTSHFVAPGIDSLNVRMGPSSAYPAVGLLMPGAEVTGIPYAGWLQITEGSLVGGCVSTDYLTTDRPTETPPVPCPRIVGRVTTDNQFANIRSGPGFSHPIVGRYACHEQVAGALVADGPWIRTDRGYLNGGTIAIYATDPGSLNGCIPLHLLSPIPLSYNTNSHFDPGYTPATPRYLNGCALSALHRLQAAFKQQFGHFATIDLTYRSYDEQQYWHERFGSPRAAHPGTSNHGYGLAIDFEERDSPWIFSWGAVANRWLLTHQARFGFHNPYASTLQEGEDYHFNFVG